MKLAEFTTTTMGNVWVNPDSVDFLETNYHNGTIIHLRHTVSLYVTNNIGDVKTAFETERHIL